jgi:hypothetical protein
MAIRTGQGLSGGILLFLQADYILIRDFPAELLFLAALLEMLFKEDRTAGISHKCARCREKDIAGAILHLNPAPEEG